MEFRLLGPVEVSLDGCVIDAGRPRQRVVLAALLVDAGRHVSSEVLIDRVWGEMPPQGARRALHAHLARIRRLIEYGGASVAPLAYRSGGYLIDIDPDAVDLHRFRRLVADARSEPIDRHIAWAAADGDEKNRVQRLREALRLWRGEPLAGLPAEWAARTRQSWTQERLDTTIAWSNAELSIGNAEVTIGPLSDLIAEHPLLEPLVAVLLRALHAVGRSAIALDHYAALRERLADQLGADPSAQVQAVHQAILRGDSEATLNPRTLVSIAARPSPAKARTLPSDVAEFAGRSAPLARLDALLKTQVDVGERETSAAVVISAVSGTAGVGKTALAVRWAHTAADRFPDGQLYVNLRGFYPGDEAMDPAQAIRGFLDALGVAPERIPPGLDAQVRLYRSLTAGKRILVILDNARDADHARPLLPATGTAMAIVTSRNQLTSLVATDGAHPLMLDVLTDAEARDLLTRRLGADRVDAEPDAVNHIITACARLPLALAITAARARQTHFPLATLAAELAQAHQRLDILDAGDAASQIKAVFSWSYTTLSTPARRLFRLLGLHPGPDISTPATASLAGLSMPQTRRLLSELTRANLLAEHVPGRYLLHDLLRAYAADLVATRDTKATRHAATSRLLDHYLHTAHTAERLLHPARDPITLPLAAPATDVRPERLVDRREATAWLDVERSVLLAAIRHAADIGYDAHAWQLTWAIDTSLHRNSKGHDRRVAWQAALQAARRLRDPAAQAYAHLGAARADIQSGEYAAAHAGLRHALDLYTQAGDQVGQAHAHRPLSELYARQGNTKQALAHCQQALELYRMTGHRWGHVTSLNGVGWFHAQLGNHAEALTYCQDALALQQQSQDEPHHEATIWATLGYIHHNLGNLLKAIDCFQRALALYPDHGGLLLKGLTLAYLADTHHAAGDLDAASRAWNEALQILTDLDHPRAQAVRRKLGELQHHNTVTPVP